MARFCSQCGHPLTNSSAKFCEDCGCPITSSESAPLRPQALLAKEGPAYDSEECSYSSLTTRDLGSRFEAFVEEILAYEGYKTQRNVRLPGSDGHLWEIDILATKNRDGILIQKAVECKNYSGAVGREKVYYFCNRLKATGIKNGLFVAYSRLTHDAREVAEANGIMVWEQDDLAMRILGLRSGRSFLGQEERFKHAVPQQVSFEEARKLNLRNPESVFIDSARLVWKPYYRIGYRLRADFRLPDGTVKKINDNGFCVVNSINPEEIFLQNEDGTIRDASLTSGLGKLKRAFTGEVAEDAAISKELAKGIVNDYVARGGTDFQLVKVNPLVNRGEAKRIALLEITERNTQEFTFTTKKDDIGSKVYTPRNNDVFLSDIRPVFVPVWEIGFSSSGRSYSRRMLAGSGTVLEDTIDVCPNHMLKDIVKVQKKSTIAVCEVCGDALCEKHIAQCPVCGRWLCEEHSQQCSSCGLRFCKEHLSNTCLVCNHALCHACVKTCRICGKPLCDKHQVVCSICSKIVCSDCSNISGGLLRKTYTCKACRR